MNGSAHLATTLRTGMVTGGQRFMSVHLLAYYLYWNQIHLNARVRR